MGIEISNGSAREWICYAAKLVFEFRAEKAILEGLIFVISSRNTEDVLSRRFVNIKPDTRGSRITDASTERNEVTLL